MDGEQTAGSVFMCRLCHLFSPSCSQLLLHCSQLHPEQESPEDIMIALQPLIAEPVETLAEGPVKRKRGRPKGSTKKIHINLTEDTTTTTHSAEDGFKREQKKRNKEEVPKCSSDKVAEGEILKLECRHCHRSFGNKRQILKHICLKQDDKEEDDTENEGVCGAEIEGGSGGAIVNHTKQKSARVPKEKDVNSFKLSRGNRSHVSNEEDPTGQKKSVIGFVLTEDKILPGVSKMVPVEDNSAETESAAVQAHHQQPVSEVTSSENNTTTEQEPSSSPNSATAETNKGFQEYSIKQDNINLRPNQLKIFACEFCHKIFKFRHSLVSHLRIHTQEKPFQCPHCEYASAIKANLNVHLRKHTGEKFSCDHCSFSSPSPGHLKVHVERVHQKVKQHCSFCEKKYSDVKNLLKHIEKHHNLKEPAVFLNYQELRLKTRKGLRQLLYHCPTCNRHFKNQLCRERHMLMHGPQPPFACLLCNYAATKMIALAAHVRKHLFLYACCACNKQLVSSHRLRGHLEESHPELDQERAFANSINISYCLIPPEGGEEAQRRAMEEHKEGEDDRDEAVGSKERDREQQMMKEQDKSLDGGGEVQITAGASEKEEELKNKGAQESSQDRCEEGAAEEKLHKTTCSSAAENTHTSLSPESVHNPLQEDGTQENTRTSSENNTSSSLGNTNSDLSKDTPSSSGPQVDNGQTSLSEKSAFQQVFSSLQKTRLDMETFQRLRKLYGDLECQHCGKLFWYKVHFNVHVRTHTKEHLHYCSKCSYSSITKSSLNRHQIQKHSGLLLLCSVPGCKYSTPDKYKLQAHTKTHHNQGSSATCPVCQCSFPEHRLKYHIKSSHPGEVPVQGKRLMVQRAEKCPYCDSYFLKNSSDFQQHIWAHQGLKPYVCGVCNYSSRNRSNLKTHMNRHNTESHHLCDLCGKKFKSKLTLKSHRLSHTDEGKKFQCSECHFTSVFKPSLLRHMEQHAKFKPFRCAHCHYSCNVTGVLKRHYKMKHPDETYENAGPGLPNSDTLEQQGALKCPECEFVYGTKWELNRHLKNKHNLKVVEARWEVAEETEAQFVSVEDEEQLTDAPVAILEDSVNIQQITKLSSETHSAVASLVAMGPGTVAVVQQVAEEQEVGDCSDQLMVVNAEGAVDGNQVMVVEDASGLEALTVLTQGENAHHYIVYIQEQTVEIN